MNNKFSPSLFCLILINIGTSCAQEDITGVYNRSHKGDPHGASHLFVLENNRFVVTFFGGAIAGTWNITKGNLVEFKPDVPKQKIYLYGRHNKDIKDSCRIFFQGFENNETFIGFEDKAPLRRVFNPSPNCFSYPYVYKFPHIPGQMIMADKEDKEPNEKQNETSSKNIYTFKNTKKYNDFVAYYFEEHNDRRPFYAKIKEKQLFLSEDHAAQKRPLSENTKDLIFIKNIANMPQETNSVMYNPFYEECREDIAKDTLNWRFEQNKNAYINFLNYVEGEDNTTKIVYEFQHLPVTGKSAGAIAIDEVPLFVVKCKDRE
ncbi:hypothetical protein [Pedobacter caeni]|uniref:Uncharacterized protein n=1 Tax=Pedobacter caeni TaxID=288992 RepID=A0A1M5ENV6_9SPHI|nr:hypothetical protein [Pedobacter caeni]SHF80897.1 hypothetical protein SAMN04488522_103727 [Pedobacter caeni]